MSIEKHLKNKFDFTFSGKIDDEQDGLFLPSWCEEDLPLILFSARFQRGYRDLSVDVTRMKDEKLVYERKGLEGKRAWSLFEKYATFKDIFDSTDCYQWHDILNKQDELSQYFKYDEYWRKKYHGNRHLNGEDIVFMFSPSARAIFRGETMPEPERRTKLALEVIRDAPAKLYKKEYASELIQLLETARYSFDDEAAKKALKLISEHLLPSRRKALKPLNAKAIKDVTVKLARYLSHVCKELIDYDLERGEKISNDIYKEIKQRAYDNGEFRLTHLHLDDLNTLINTPAQYASQLLTTYFNNISLKTMTG